MKLLNRYITTALAALTLSLAATAQDDNGVVRRRAGDGPDRRSRDNNSGAQVTDRMQAFYEETPTSDADLQWMRVVYRGIDLEDPVNAPLYFPEDVIDGQENMFRLVMRLVAQGQVPAYEYLDGREIFTDQYRINVRDMLDRFHILYTPAKGSSERNPKFDIEESDVPTNEVLSYYLLERWEFDTRTNRTRTIVEAVCPVLHRSGDFGGDAVRYPMFWLKMSDLRPYLAQQYIFLSDDNNLPTHTLDDFFGLNMYKGDIYKTRNLHNKSMAQLYPDPDDRKRAQDSIQNRLESFDSKLWVPTREEVIAAREAREAAELAAAESDSIVIRDRDSGETNAGSKRTTARGSKSKQPKEKKQKVKKAKEPKQSNSNSNAVRSVRRRK